MEPSGDSGFTGWRGLRLIYGFVVATFFGCVAILLGMRIVVSPSAKKPSMLPLIAGTMVLSTLFAAYGIDQFLTGIRPARARWSSMTAARKWGTVVMWGELILLFLGFAFVFFSRSAPPR